MSYLNGIGSAQQSGVAEATASSSIDRTAKLDQGSTADSVKDGASGSSPVDQTTLSSTASIVAQALSGSDDVRTEKVAALQQSIATGTYNVSSADVASKVLSALMN
jgi:negative regulator of flagellin synthesis FlgM